VGVLLTRPRSLIAVVNGYDVVKESVDVRRSIGYLSENVEFYDALSLNENLAFFGRLSGLAKPDDRIAEVLRFLDFEGHETEQDISDRLQLLIENTTSETLTDLEVFYEMTDTRSKETESYYQKLSGFSLAPGEKGTVYFDNEAGPGHYPENAFSLYRTSKNEVAFTIEVSAPGFQPATAETAKAPGNEAEGAD
jgi:hypothetical protein